MSMTQGNHEGGRMTDIVKGMVNVLMQSLTADGGEGADPEEAMRAALLWLASNVSDEMGCALLQHLPDTAFRADTKTAIAAALRAAAGSALEAKP